jgi:hypothetical protein
MAGQSVVGRGSGLTGAGNSSDGIVNHPRTAFVEVMAMTKWNQPMSKAWAERQLKELVVLGSVRNIRQISKNQLQMTCRSELVSMVRNVIGNNMELMSFYVIPESDMGGGK